MRVVLLVASFILAASGCVPITVANSDGTEQVSQPERTSVDRPIEWFRRANDATNIRLPGSTPFRMKVTFHAFPGIDFSKPGQSPIQSGDGVYEEVWLSPEKWRREITFGDYHAVEVRADGVRKMQSSSDYEPS